MTMGYSVTVRNARLDVVESTIGTGPLMRILSGSMPATCATTQTGTLISTITLPTDWMAAASSGAKAMSGTWSQPTAAATGTAGYFRILDSTGTTCHIQGTITATGGGGDMTVDNTSFTAGQSFTVTSFTLTAGNP